MNYSITFHGPFRVATGDTSAGLDITVDLTDPVPASSLKGAMRNAAAQLLGPGHPLINEVFGGTGDGSPWSWSGAQFPTAPISSVRARIAIGPEGVVEERALLRGQHLDADIATFSVDLLDNVAGAIGDHQLLLNASAAAISSIGGSRNRGFGWVTITPDDHPRTGADLATGIVRLRTGASV